MSFEAQPLFSSLNPSSEILNFFQSIVTQLNGLVEGYLASFSNIPMATFIAILCLPIITAIVFKVFNKIFGLITKNYLNIEESQFYQVLTHGLWYLVQISLIHKAIQLLEPNKDVLEFTLAAFILALLWAFLARDTMRGLVFNFKDQFSYIVSERNTELEALFTRLVKLTAVYWFLGSLLSSYRLDSIYFDLVIYIAFCIYCHPLKKHIHRVLVRIIPEEAVSKIESFDQKVLPKIAAPVVTFFLLFFALFQKLILELSFLSPLKSLSAKIIQMQASEGQSLSHFTLKNDLKAQFESLDGKSKPDTWHELINKAEQYLSQWLTEEREEASLVLLGQPGYGLNTIIDEIVDHHINTKTMTVTLEQRITTVSELHKILKAQLEIPTDQSIGRFFREISEPTVIVIKDAEKLFINRVNGFEAYEELLNLYNLSNKTFWLLGIDYLPWCFLRSYQQDNMVFRDTLTVPGITDDDLKNILLSFLKDNDYTLSFEKDLYKIASQKGRESKIENVQTHYFRILNNSSFGSLELALKQWSSSIVSLNDKKIVVGLPREDDKYETKEWRSNVLLVLSQIQKHGPLNIKELIDATDFSFRQVYSCLRFLIESDILESIDGKYQIQLDEYFQIKKFLKSRNYIYE